MLKELRGFQADKHDIDELVLMKSTADSMLATYASIGVEAPEWLQDAAKAVDKEVRARNRDMLEKELKEVQLRRESLRTTEEKRQALDAKEARLKAALGQ